MNKRVVVMKEYSILSRPQEFDPQPKKQFKVEAKMHFFIFVMGVTSM